MERKFVQIAALVLAVVLLTVGSGLSVSTASAANVSSTVVRVGLAYGSNALDGANLANSVGSGFRFGYFDGSNQFVQLGTTTQTALSVVKTTNVGYGTYNGYSSYHEALTGASVMVGCYHIQLSGSYTSFAAAQAAASQYDGGFPAYVNGKFYARVGNSVDRAGAVTIQNQLAEEGVEAAIVGTSSYGVSVVITGTNTIVFQFDDNGSGTGLGIMPNTVDRGEEYVTLFNTVWLNNNNNRWYGGFRYERVNGGDLTVVNMVKLEDYVKGVAGSEMPNTWHIEALKAQAVCARTYALSTHAHTSYHFDVCSTTHCQVYTGLRSLNNNVRSAVEQTAGVTATYNGKYIGCFYYSSNGGASIDSSVVWGGSQSSYPYLLGKVDPYEATITIPSYSWSRQFTFAELSSKLGFASTIVSARVTSYTQYGNPLTLVFTTQNGREYTVATKDLVKALSLRSYRYDLGPNGGMYTGGSSTGGGTGGYTINGNSTVSSLDGMYAINGSGNAVQISGNAYVITGDNKTVTAGEWSGNGSGNGSTSGRVYTGTNGYFVISGRGFGHNVGMSQYGAYAMAGQGYNYKQILQFYYTGITVG